jgi:hypothetical protein
MWPLVCPGVKIARRPPGNSSPSPYVRGLFTVWPLIPSARAARQYTRRVPAWCR